MSCDDFSDGLDLACRIVVHVVGSAWIFVNRLRLHNRWKRSVDVGCRFVLYAENMVDWTKLLKSNLI